MARNSPVTTRKLFLESMETRTLMAVDAFHFTTSNDQHIPTDQHIEISSFSFGAHASSLTKAGTGTLVLTNSDQHALIGLLLPAVQKVHEISITKTGAGTLDLSNGDKNALIGLLLPAVQKVREAAARSQSSSGNETSILIGLLVPAVHEAAQQHNLSAGEEKALIGLLLPAVQKVREAAAHQGADAVFDLVGNANTNYLKVTMKDVLITS
jgi:hypothetical protein